MLTHAIDVLKQQCLYCFFFTLANSTKKERNLSLIHLHFSLLSFLAIFLLSLCHLDGQIWDESDESVCWWKPIRATEDRLCRLFVVGVGPELQRDPWQGKLRLSIIVSVRQVAHYVYSWIITTPDIRVWINSFSREYVKPSLQKD